MNGRLNKNRMTTAADVVGTAIITVGVFTFSVSLGLIVLGASIILISVLVS
jgi:hypothetical protein